MNTFIIALGLTLVHFLWQGVLLGGVTAVTLALLRNQRAEYRYLVACTALLACLCWPVLDLLQRLHSDDAAIRMQAASFGLATQALTLHRLHLELGNALRSIVSLWALCAVALALRMAAGLLWIERAARRNDPMHDRARHYWQAKLSELAARFGIRRAVRLRISDALASPVTAGWLRPVVLVPASLVSGMPADLLEALLAHELAHVQRHDYLVNLLQNVIETLLFYHPAVWWISNRIRVERELVADDFAARQLGEPRRLALALSELEKRQFSTHQLAQAANGGDLMERIKRLCRPAPQAFNWKAALPMMALAVACASIYAEATAADKAMPQRTPAIIDFSSCAKPAWPEGAIAAERTGTVTLDFLISAKGEASDSKVIKSSGHADLDEAARAGIMKCKFKPATKAGVPVETWQKLQYVWTLE